jgi:hypothetical protein
LWLDGADSNSMTLSGSTVTSWRDKSGNGYTGTSSGSPTLVTGSQSGLSCINFVASSSQYFDFGNILPLTSAGITVFAVGKSTFVGGTNQAIVGKSLYGGQAGRWSLLQEDTSIEFLTETSAGGVTPASPAAPYSGVFSLFEGAWDGSRSYVYANGTQLNSSATTGSAVANNDPVYVGAYQNTAANGPQASFYWNGTIGEILVFSNTLNTGHRQAIEGYLTWKWGIENIPQALTVPGVTPRNILSIPTSIGGCVLWCDASQGYLRNFATAASPQGMLTIASTGTPKTAGKNGLDTVTFTTSQTWTVSPTFELFSYTMFWVGRQTGGTNGRVLNSSDGYNQLYGYWGGHKRQLHTSSWNSGPYGYPSDTAWDMFSHSRIAGGAFTFNWNGATHASGSSSSGNPLHGFRINSGDYGEQSDCEVAEIILYNSVLAPLQIQEVENYLAKKWDFAMPTPTSVAGLSLWLDGADASSLVLSGTNVTAWKDKSGNGSHAVQATSADQPTYASSGVVFSGAQSLVSPYSAVLSAETIFAVYTPATSTGHIVSTSAAGGRTFEVYSNQVYGTVNYVGVWGTGFYTAPGTRYFQCFTRSSSGVALFNSGTSVFTSGTRYNTFGSGITWIGRCYDANSFTGTIHEVICYNSVLSTNDRQTVEAYLTKKWRLSQSDCVLWLDAADPSGNGVIPADNSTIATWVDKSGSGNNGSASGIIKYNAASSGLIFTGSERFQIPDNAVPIGDTAFTYFFVYNSTDAGSGPGLLGCGTFAVQTCLSLRNGNSGNATMQVYWGAYDLETTISYTPNVNQIVCLTYTGNSGIESIYINGRLGVTSSPGVRAQTSGPNYIGSTSAPEYWHGQIMEAMCFSTALSITQQQEVESYLATKWGVTLGGGYMPLLNNPVGVPGCALWLDAADKSSLTFSSGSNVSVWRDKSGNGNSPVASAGAYPTYSAASNCITWNSTANTQLVFPSSISNAVVGTAFTVFIVEQRTKGGDNFIIRGSTESTNSNLLIGTIDPSPGIRFAFYANDLDLLVPTYASGEPKMVGSYQYSRPGRAIYKNGVLGSTDANASDLLSWTGAMIGGNVIFGSYSGNVFEMLIYNRSLNSGQRQAVERYLSLKWAVSNVYTSVPGRVPGLSLWFDAADPAATGGGSTVSTWKDKSSFGSNAIANSAITLASNAIGGLPALSFSPSTPQWLLGSTSIVGQALTVFSVFNAASSYNGAFRVIALAAPNANDYNSSEYVGILQQSSGLGPYRGGTFAYGPFTYGSNSINTSIIDGRMSYVYPNGVLTATTDSGFTNPLVISSYALAMNTNLYDPQYFNGYIGEIIVYSTVLSTTQRQAVESYLARKWSLAVPTEVLPIEHPFRSIKPHARSLGPMDIPGCGVWLDGADQSSFTLSGTSVTTWRDKSGNGYHAVADGGTVTYSASSKELTFPGNAQLQSPVNITGPNISIFIVFNQTSAPLVNHVMLNGLAYGGSPSGGRVIYTSNNGTTVNDGQYGTGNEAAGTANSISVGNTYIVSIIATTTGTIYTNGTNTTASGFTPTWSTAPYTMAIGSDGSSQFFIGTMREIIVYTSPLTTSQRQQVEGYLAHKWSLRSNFLSTHPFAKIPPCFVLPFTPDAVASVTATASGAIVSASWTSSIGTATYTVALYSSSSSGGTYTLVSSKSVSTLTTSFTVTSNAYYKVYVTAVNDIGAASTTTQSGEVYGTVPSPPALITSAVANSGANVTSASLSFTAAPYSVVLFFIALETSGGLPLPSLNSLSGLGLTWIEKITAPSSSQVNNNRGYERLALWYAINNSASSASGSIDVDYNGYCDAIILSAASFSGCNLTNPWSSTAPQTAFYPAYGRLYIPVNAIPETLTLSILFLGCSAYSFSMNTPSGQTSILSSSAIGQSYGMNINLSYLRNTTAQSSTSIYLSQACPYPISIIATLVS